MKKIFTTAMFISASAVLFGQSLHLSINKSDVTNTTITVPVKPGDMSETELAILNTTGNSINYQVNRTILNPPMNDSCASLYFCAGVTCYPPNADITWTPKTAPISIAAHGSMPDGNGTYGVFAHYDVCPSVCNELYVKYRVYNTASNTNDTAYVTIKYTCSNGIKEYTKSTGFISDAYPNPSSTNVCINYQLNKSKGEIILHDVIGKEMQRMKLNDTEGKVTIDVSQLPAGIYFYSLFVDGYAVNSKKIIIQ